MHDKTALPSGEFEITLPPLNIKRALRWLIPVLALPAMLFLDRMPPALRWVVMALSAVGYFVIMRTLPTLWRMSTRERRYVIRLNDEFLTVQQPSGQGLLPWSAVVMVHEQPGGDLILRSASTIIALPWHAMTDVQKSAVNAYLAAHPRAQKSRDAQRKRLLWVVLIVFFFVLYTVTTELRRAPRSQPADTAQTR
jgi:hypothetical protein